MAETTTGVDLIAAERQRQIDAEGWTPEHDDEHADGALAKAAAAYAVHAGTAGSADDPNWRTVHGEHRAPLDWPWEAKWWKPSADPIRDLAKAGALIAAEIDRLTRASDA